MAGGGVNGRRHGGGRDVLAPGRRPLPAAHSGQANHSAPARPSAPADPPVKVEIRNCTFSPDRSRVLARVTFEDPFAIAYYDIVLQKRAGDWTVASVWLGSETEKPGAHTEEPARSPGE